MMMTASSRIFFLSLSLLLLVSCSDAFLSSMLQQPTLIVKTTTTRPFRLFSTMEEEALSKSSETTTATTTETINDKGLLKRDRYIATNRFAVRSGKEAKFEQRWATRKSRLAELEGFKYFHLMRRVTLKDDDDDEKTVVYDGGNSKDSKQGNYVSFTIWQRKSDFSAWRKGDAFKEAHGGTSIGAFLSTSKYRE
jgi:heme-degrading monooxygenase HmoA